jgi:hypothetical protein
MDTQLTGSRDSQKCQDFQQFFSDNIEMLELVLCWVISGLEDYARVLLISKLFHRALHSPICSHIKAKLYFPQVSRDEGESNPFMPHWESTLTCDEIFPYGKHGKAIFQHHHFAGFGRWRDDVMTVCHYRKGKLDGPYQTFCGGEVIAWGQFKNGKKEGWHANRYQGGKMKKSCIYVNGEENGPCKIWEFYEDGHSLDEGLMRNGRKWGVWRRWKLLRGGGWEKVHTNIH